MRYLLLLTMISCGPALPDPAPFQASGPIPVPWSCPKCGLDDTLHVFTVDTTGWERERMRREEFR